MANMSISRRIATLGGRLPIDQGAQRTVGPVWINLAAQMADATLGQSIDLTSATAFNGSKAVRSVFSNTGSAPEAIMHIEAVQWWISSSVWADASSALKAQVMESASIKAVIGGTVTEYDLLQYAHEPFGSNAVATTAATTTLERNRYIGTGPLILPSPLRIDVQDDQLTLEVDTGSFGAVLNTSCCVYGWVYPRSYADSEAFNEGGCGPGTVTPERAAALQTRFFNQLGVPLMG